MKLFVVLSVFVASALCARLDNTYIPPPNAQSAGGQNLEAPRLALASTNRNNYAQPQSQYQQQSYNQGGVSQNTYTASQQGQGFQSVSSGAYSGQNYQQPQANYGARQQQNNYNQQSGSQQGYNQESTTPIPIIKCKCFDWMRSGTY